MAKVQKKAAAKKAVAKVEGKKAEAKKVPGVIDRIVEVMKAGGGTVEQIATKVAKHFPDRKVTAITGTVRVQVNRLTKSPEQGGRGLKVKRDEVEGGGFTYSI